jgi:uncharacterized protein
MLLAVFAKAPEPGKVKTRLCPPLTHGEAAALYGAFLGDTLERMGAFSRARGIGLVVAHDGEERVFRPLAPPGARFVRQRGEGLAARLRSFFEDAFAGGSGPVVVVGSDAPTLPLDRVEAAFAVLASGRAAAICPDEGGGYCLIGLSRPFPVLFEGVEMGSPRVAEQTRERAERAGIALAVLEPWHDVDTPEDLARLTAELRDPTVEAPRTRMVLRALGEEARCPAGRPPA